MDTGDLLIQMLKELQIHIGLYAETMKSNIIENASFTQFTEIGSHENK